jgi:predicted N-acetyltransferase YhbS
LRVEIDLGHREDVHWLVAPVAVNIDHALRRIGGFLVQQTPVARAS